MSKVVITGSNRGIGLELCRQLAARGEQIVAVCRSASDELAALAGEASAAAGRGVEIVEGIDVTQDADVARFAQELGDASIDCLVNNAGVLHGDSLGTLDFDLVRDQLEVNSIAPLRVTRALLDRVPKGGKVAVVTSMMGSMHDNDSGAYYGYRMSKAAVNAAFVSLAHDIAPRGISVAILHPGYVQTRMTGFAGNLTPQESARGLIARLDDLDASNSGTFWHANGEVIPW